VCAHPECTELPVGTQCAFQPIPYRVTDAGKRALSLSDVPAACRPLGHEWRQVGQGFCCRICGDERSLFELTMGHSYRSATVKRRTD
jgi:rubredoxin